MPDPIANRLVNSPGNTTSGSVENRLKALDQEKQQLERVRAEQEVNAERERERLVKMQAPPADFTALMQEKGTRKIADVRFRDDVQLKGARPSKRFYLVDGRGDVVENALSPWYGAIGLRTADGEIHVWIAKTGEVMHIPRENVSNYAFLDEKAEAKLESVRAARKAPAPKKPAA